MKPIRIAALLVLPLLVNQASAQVERPGGHASPADPIEVELSGIGRGTLVLPVVQDGEFVANLVDVRTATVYRLSARLTPYYFILDHPPAGRLDGVLYSALDLAGT